MALEPFLSPELLFVRPHVRSREELFDLLAARAASLLAPADAAHLREMLEQRESQGSTATPEGVAFPHAISSRIPRTLLGVVVTEPGIEFERDRSPATIVLCLFGSSATPWEHVRLLARLSRIVAPPEARRRLRQATNPDELLERLREEDRSHG